MFGSLTEEEQRFALMLKAEFERDGIQLPEAEREAVRSLNQELVNLETTFQRNTMTHEHLFQVPTSTVANISPEVWAHLPQGQQQGAEANLSVGAQVTLSTEPRLNCVLCVPRHESRSQVPGISL